MLLAGQWCIPLQGALNFSHGSGQSALQGGGGSGAKLWSIFLPALTVSAIPLQWWGRGT